MLRLTPLLLVATIASPVEAQVFLTDEKALELAFPGAEIGKSVIALTKEQRAAVAERTGLKRPSPLFKLWIATRDGGPIGYAVIDNVRGKARPITYMVATDLALAVTRVEILVYRESHGWQVQQEGWRRQFVGAGPDTPLRLGSSIRNVVGATISCRSVTEGVRRNLSYLAVLFPPRTATDLAATSKAAPGTTSSSPELFRRSRVLMGTTLELTLHAPDAETVERASEAAYAEVAAVEAALSSWLDSSSLSELNGQAGEPPRERGAMLIDFLGQCRRWSRATGGAVDVTAGPLVSLWRRATTEGRVPNADDIATARALVGDDLLLLDPANGRAGLARPGAALDAGAIGKGYALDRAAAALRQHGVASALLNFGGQVLATGPHPDGARWRVQLRDRDGTEQSPLWLETGSIAVTADGERGLQIGELRFSHVIDPRTGRPVKGMESITVHADNATDADALSTALFVMSGDEAVRWATEHGVSARIEGHDRCKQTGEFARLERAKDTQR